MTKARRQYTGNIARSGTAIALFIAASGGAAWRPREEEYGNIYDHCSADFVYADGSHMSSYCRQYKNSAGLVAERIVGTKGVIDSSPLRGNVNGINPYEQEHRDMMASILGKGPYINEAMEVAESTLTCIICLPLLAAIVLTFVPRNYRVIMRAVAIIATLISALLAIKMFAQFHTDRPGYQFEQQVSWVQSLGMSYHVGVDGINVGIILMGAIVAFAAACCAWEIQTREKEFYILLLVMAGGILASPRAPDVQDDDDPAHEPHEVARPMCPKVGQEARVPIRGDARGQRLGQDNRPSAAERKAGKPGGQGTAGHHEQQRENRSKQRRYAPLGLAPSAGRDGKRNASPRGHRLAAGGSHGHPASEERDGEPGDCHEPASDDQRPPT